MKYYDYLFIVFLLFCLTACMLMGLWAGARYAKQNCEYEKRVEASRIQLGFLQ